MNAKSRKSSAFGPVLIATMGDPGGLGPELLVRVLSKSLPENARILIIGSGHCLSAHARFLKIKPFWRELREPELSASAKPGVYLFCPPDIEDLDIEPGKASVEGGLAAGRCIETALDLVLDGSAQGLVTCPLNKDMLGAAGFEFPGHTEFLAHGSGLPARQVCMHFYAPKLSVSLVTTHPPLSEVPSLVTTERVITCLRLTSGFMDRLGRPGPIAVCGLNPHAGESGRIGREEIEVIAPAVSAAKTLGVDAVGPLPADTVFHFALKGHYCAVLAMYHDQGLAPFKMLYLHQGVNVTLGLPFVRTSPDHGTGYDLAGKGVADTGSFKAALDLALKLAKDNP